MSGSDRPALTPLLRELRELTTDARVGTGDVAAARALVERMDAVLGTDVAEEGRINAWTELARTAQPGAARADTAAGARRGALHALGMPEGTADSRELLLWGHLTGGREHDVVSDPHHVTVDLAALSPLARAVAQSINTNSRRSPGALVRLRSALTRGQIADELPLERRERLLEQARVYDIDLDAPDEVEFSRWKPYRPLAQTPEAWCEEAAALLPAGYAPVPAGETEAPEAAREVALVLVDQVEKVRAATARLEAARQATGDVETTWREVIVAALAAGVPATTIAGAAGVHRARVYQLRDGTR